MKADIKLLLDCDAIYMLPNWEVSNGATLEREIAKTLGLEIVYERQPQHRDIKHAIYTAMFVPFKVIAADSRERWHVFARMIYAHHCKKTRSNNAGDSRGNSPRHLDNSLLFTPLRKRIQIYARVPRSRRKKWLRY